MHQLVTCTGEVELANPLRNGGVHQDISRGEKVLRSPRQEERSIFRTGVEQGPRFDGTRDPSSPKLRKANGHFVPTSTDSEKLERSDSESRVAVS